MSLTTEVRDDVWPGSWSDVFTDYAAWEQAGEPEGYVWGVNWSLAYPGIKAIEPSSKADTWTPRVQHVRHFNQGGEGWSPPVPPERENGADYESTGPNGTLRLQVTRVPHDPGRWARLSRDGHIDGDVDIPAAAQDLLGAIRNKAGKLGTSGITLVLDGSSSLAYTLANTVDHFDGHFADELKGLGFRASGLSAPSTSYGSTPACLARDARVA